MIKKIFIIILVALTLTGIILFSQKKIDKNALIVGTNAEYYPFTFIEDNEFKGFDIDIAKEVGKRLNKKIHIKDMPFETLIPEITLGNLHFAAAGLTYTDEKAKRVFFTKPYLTDDSLVILTLGNAKNLELKDLIGKKVVVNEGYTADLFVSKFNNLNIIRLNAPSDGFLALQSNHAEAFVTAKSTLSSFIKNKNFEKFQFNEIENSSDHYSLVVSKKYPKMLVEIQKILDEMLTDGTIDKLKSKWNL
ncbi:MAG: putative histidine-binding protein [Candidatus Anoxychlamydiales bacterium]|uniref:Solute-binding protein family 3/N-terminal domain-containing protein n=1 Tax=marine sediment metagenome TaxID=412755 RepID=A0A0F9KHF8_9ZZZZ|nr:putative histidine-binding protein [Candidatus Anoxychlamydiales bacterium]NGX41670.1 putative histidine-binding protein [Candidatus Anoxychlamydiales bacterium]HEU63835.1 amino acid ABC transporter substrate-binding protein [Chlamydiota bacterium]